MLAFMQKQIRMIRTLIEISEMYTKTFKISTLWVNRQIGKGVNSSVFHRLITIHVTFIPEVVYITHEKSESRINFKSGESFTSSSITSNWNGKIKSNNSFLYHWDYPISMLFYPSTMEQHACKFIIHKFRRGKI